MVGESETKAAAARLRQARQAKGLEDASAGAAYLGVNKNTYLQHENGTRSYKFVAGKYAGRYDTTPEWLLWGRGDAPQRRYATVPLVGNVGAGGEAHFYASADEGLGEVEAPEGATALTRAAEIRGESLGPVFEHWLIFYDDVRDPVSEDLIGELCIVGLPNGKVLIKRLRKAREEHHFHLESNTEGTMFDQLVSWAAKVKTMRPR